MAIIKEQYEKLPSNFSHESVKNHASDSQYTFLKDLEDLLYQTLMIASPK